MPRASAWLRHAAIKACGLALALSAVSLAAAADRRYPADTLRVRIAPATSNTLLVNGVEIWLAPGARIFSAGNRTIVPGRVPANALARVQPDSRGEIRTAWILTPEEIAEDVPDSDLVHVTPIRQ